LILLNIFNFSKFF